MRRSLFSAFVLEEASRLSPDTLATLLKDRHLYDVSGSSAVEAYEYARVSLPDSVLEAQLLLGTVACDGKEFD